MAYQVVRHRVKELGFCCSFSYFHTVRFEKIAEVAAELKVSERTTKAWRAHYRKDELQCEKSDNCFLKPPIPRAPPKCLDSVPALAGDLDLALADEQT